MAGLINKLVPDIIMYVCLSVDNGEIGLFTWQSNNYEKNGTNDGMKS